MRKKPVSFQSSAVLFSAGFFVGLFVKFIPFFIILMLLFLVAGGISKCRYH